MAASPSSFDDDVAAAGRSSAAEGQQQEPDLEKRSTTSGSALELDDDDADAASSVGLAKPCKAERRFLWKLDLCLLTWAWLAYCIKQIDSSNYKTAYASGMKEDLNLGGNELNYMDTTYRVGYALFLIPSQLVLADGRVQARFWLPALECAWGVCVGLMACMKSATGIYVLRFFIGVFEASSYPGIISVLCAWYTPTELATRIAIFGTSYPGAQIFVSFMQAALWKSMRNKGLLQPWQYLFVFNAIMTIFVAVFGFWLVPDNPVQSNVVWLNGEEKEIAKRRMVRVKKLPPTKVTLSLIKKVFRSWVIYAFTLAYCCWTWSQNSNTWIILWLKALKNADGTARFGVSELNAIPIGGYVLQIVAMLAFGWLSDRTGWRASLVVVQELTLLVGAIILAVWPASFGLKMFAFFTLWLSNAAGPILVAWMADLTPCPSQRAIILGVCLTLVFAIDSFANIFIYPASQAPHYHVGYKAAAGFAGGCMLFTGAFWWLAQRTQASREARALVEAECTCPPAAAETV